jgi:hypothetical protein
MKKPYNAEDEASIREARKRAEDEDQDLIKIMETQRGRRYVFRLIYETCHTDTPSHTPGDPHSSAFNEGARAVGLAVRADARRSPNYLKMLEENHDYD